MDKTSQIIVADVDSIDAILEKRLKEIIPKCIQVQLPDWLNEQQTLKYLHIGRTTLYKLRVEMKVRIFQDPDHRGHILYDKSSLDKYLNAHAIDTL